MTKKLKLTAELKSSAATVNQPQALHPRQEQPLRFLPLNDVIDRVGLQKSWLYAAIKAGNFPQPVSIPGARRTLFSSLAIDAWIEDRAAGVPMAGGDHHAQ